ncbi:MAG: ABC transporter permease [Candidatus Omnitrophica bacterium]|nr:ABC transporter permease [Candidatus Omnitrophota bacterium]MDD5671882.1 ABC transporter permease [Candidatus Omnitrophota bacterium]
MLLFKLAFLNIGRNPRRSVITVLAVAVGLGALIFLWGFSDGTTDQMRENVIQLVTGHAQIHAKDFEKKLTIENTVPEHRSLVKRLSGMKNVVAVTERAKCEALVGTSENSRGILLVGIDPVREVKVTRLLNYVTRGKFLMPDDKRGILLGNRLAERLEVDTGDKIVVMTQAMDGTLAGFAYHIKGILHTGSQSLDEMSAYITLDSAQELLGLEGEVHEIVVRLKERKALPAFLASVKSFLDLKVYELMTWDQVVPEVEQWAAWGEAIIRTILVAVMFVIGVGIMNTVLMSVFERTKEFGVMIAIGTSPIQVMKLIFFETFVLEFFGMILGIIGGYAVTGYFGKVGIAFPELERAFSKSYMSTVTYTQVTPAHVIQSIIILFILTSFISLYPAWKAGHTEPIKAIYKG